MSPDLVSRLARRARGAAFVYLALPGALLAVDTPPGPPVPTTLDLGTALRFAVDNNYAIRLARERIRGQEGLISEVKSQALPNAAINARYTESADELKSDRGGAANADTQDWAIALEVRQTLYAGGGVRAALDAQRLVREAALLDLQATIDGALLQVRTRFYDVLLAREQIEVQEQNVALLGEQLRTARNRFEAGAVSSFDVLRAEVEVANSQPALIRTRNAYRNAIESLRQALGYQGSEADLVRVPDFTGDLAVVPAAFTLVEALRTAREARPELRQLRIFVEAREAGVAIARAGFLPHVALVGGYQVRKSGFSDRFSDSLDGWTLGVQSNWAIFDGRATAGRVAQARSQVAQARLEAADFALGIEVEVRRAFSSWQEASELVGAAGKSVAQAEEALRLADARYGAGSATQLDQLQARTALTQARDNQLQANYSYNVAVAQLRRAMGLGDVLVAGAE